MINAAQFVKIPFACKDTMRYVNTILHFMAWKQLHNMFGISYWSLFSEIIW